jgi:hypothetical protein
MVYQLYDLTKDEIKVMKGEWRVRLGCEVNMHP